MALGGSETELGLLPLYLAEARRGFAASGVDVSLRQTRGEVSAAEALRRGQVDLAATSLAAVLQEEWKGAPPRLVVLLTHAVPAALLVGARYRDAITGLADLRGKTVGVPAPGSPSYLILVGLLRRSGIGVHQVDLRSLGYRRTGAALARGLLHAGLIEPPDVDRLVGRGQASILLDLSDPAALSRLLGGPYLHFGLFAGGETIASRAAEVEAVVHTVIESLGALARAEEEKLLEILPARVVGLPAAFRERLRAARPIYSQNGIAGPEGVETVARLLWSVVPRAEAPPKPETLLETRFLPRRGE